MPGTFLLVTISDNVTSPEDWPVARLYFDFSGCIARVERVTDGIYSFPTFVGWDLTDLQKWLNFDSTGQHPEVYHSIGMWSEDKSKFINGS